MKKVMLLLMILTLWLSSRSQFREAELQATGLTCALCSNAINKALLRLPYVSTVKADIKNSSFHIVFKDPGDVDIDGVRKAVEDAGFAVGSLKLTGAFSHVEVGNDKHVTIGGHVYHFVNVPDQVLDGDRTITIIDKDFLSLKQFKKFKAMTTMPCMVSGKTESCCASDGVAAQTRVFHVTI